MLEKPCKMGLSMFLQYIMGRLVGGVSAKGKEPFYEKMGFEIISNGMKKMIEIE